MSFSGWALGLGLGLNVYIDWGRDSIWFTFKGKLTKATLLKFVIQNPHFEFCHSVLQLSNVYKNT